MSSWASADGGSATDPRVAAFRERPLAEKLASPRHTVETFCFAIDAYDRFPGLIHEAVACLEIDARDRQAGTAELLAIDLEEILNEIVPPIRQLPARGEGKSWTLWQEQDLRIGLAPDGNGLWRFDRKTLAQVPQVKRLMESRGKHRRALRAQLQEGMEDPTATMMGFLEHAVAGDFMSAALRLDLSDVPVEQRPVQGPYRAWMLACVIQRRGYVFQQEVPIDPEGPPYTWSATQAGRIAVERMHQPGGKDTWLFTRATVVGIEGMWRAERDQLPDVRYAVVGHVVPPPPESAAAATRRFRASWPEDVPDRFASPRRMVKAFLAAMDDADLDDTRQREAYCCLDLSQFPAEDIPMIGPKRAEMLHAVLRKLRPDFNNLPERWSAPPQILAAPPSLRVEIVRQADGCWRFSGETVAQLPAMYATLGSRERLEDEQLHGLSNPREALLTFLTAIDDNDDVMAARCLDLTNFPTSARVDIGPVLAFKIKYVLDRVYRIFLAEIPTDPDGPQVVLYRGPLGRIILGPREAEDGKRVWGFTGLTVHHTEEMFERILHQPTLPDLRTRARSEPAFLMEPGIWLRMHLPHRLHASHFGLEVYQWLGLPLLVIGAWATSILARGVANRMVRRYMHWHGHRGDDRLIRIKLRSLQAFVFLILTYLLLEWLDLPVALSARLYVVQKLLLAVVLTWAGLQWADLARLFHEHAERRDVRSRTRATNSLMDVSIHEESKHLDPRRGLTNLIAPFVVNAVKVSVMLAAAIFLLYQFGRGEALTRFLAGVGIAGLAVSLAAQDSLKNLFGTLLLIGDRSFRIGDRLLISGHEGIVEEVGFRSTKLRTPDDSLLILPNAMLAGGMIDNLGLRAYRRVSMTFSLALNTPVEKVTALRDAVLRFVHEHRAADSKRIDVNLQKIGELGIELAICAYFEGRNSNTEERARDELTCEVLRQARALEIELRGTKK